MPAALSPLSLPGSPAQTPRTSLPAPRCCQNCGSAAPRREQENLAGHRGRMVTTRGTERWHLKPFPAGIPGGHGVQSPGAELSIAPRNFITRGQLRAGFSSPAPVYPTPGPASTARAGPARLRFREGGLAAGFVHLAEPELLPELLIPGEHRSIPPALQFHGLRSSRYQTCPKSGIYFWQQRGNSL